ncbi:MAG: MerR family transcriptional regulator [Acidobacteria bacterium]|nr:MerR family transcriptional regulator [Acidobacteriota bacterium]
MFDPAKLYLTNDPALLMLGRPSTLAHWRSEGRGPAFVKLGMRVGYRGSDLNAWIELRTIQPMDGQQAGA